VGVPQANVIVGSRRKQVGAVSKRIIRCWEANAFS
jgi:hypothetical protein